VKTEDEIIVFLKGDITDLGIEFSDKEDDIQENNFDYTPVDLNVYFNANVIFLIM